MANVPIERKALYSLGAVILAGAVTWMTWVTMSVSELRVLVARVEERVIALQSAKLHGADAPEHRPWGIISEARASEAE